MRISIAILVSLAASCGSTANPNFCCATEQDCAAAGVDELRPCGTGQACSTDHSCVAAECSTNTDCDDAAPVCRLGFCESTCTGDPDCAEVEGRTHCLADACVGCIDNSQCGTSMAICDIDVHACRGC